MTVRENVEYGLAISAGSLRPCPTLQYQRLAIASS
jgi:hypothetical protein